MPSRPRIFLHRLTFCFIGCALAPLSRAVEPVTQPSDHSVSQPAALSPRAAWNQTVRSFAASLADFNGEPALAQTCDDDVLIRRFNRSDSVSLPRLNARFAGMKLIAACSDLKTPTALASDIAAQVKDANLPDEIKRHLTPVDDAALKRANSTAEHWIAATLFTSGIEPIGVLVFCNREDAREDARDDQKDAADPQPAQAMFVLLKGAAGENGFKIRQVCYGDPLPADPGDTAPATAPSVSADTSADPGN